MCGSCICCEVSSEGCSESELTAPVPTSGSADSVVAVEDSSSTTRLFK